MIEINNLQPSVCNTMSFALEHVETCTSRTAHLRVVNRPPPSGSNIYFSTHSDINFSDHLSML